jgi:rare lipoprotein A
MRLLFRIVAVATIPTVRVTDLASTRSVIVRIVDRGPWIRDRVLDLSLGAARTLGITDRGVAQVRVQVL